MGKEKGELCLVCVLCLPVVEMILYLVPIDKDTQLLRILNGQAPMRIARAGMLEDLVDHVLYGLSGYRVWVEGIVGGVVFEGDVGELGDAGG